MNEDQTVKSKATQSVCAQCGSPLSSCDDTETVCVTCLLHAALGDEDAGHAAGPHRFDQYELVTGDDGTPVELGRGAMGVTYKAFDTNLRCEVALKVIHPRYLADESSRARFLSEARAAAQLHHRNIASVFHLGSERGEYFYAMELVEGETIEERVRRKGPIECATALDISLQITRALIATGDRRFVHRDVKPSNIMLCTEADGAIVAKLIDFGLVRAIIDQSASAGASLARTGFIGTPHFASPEQFAGEATDARSDIYSLGITLCFMLTGKLPFDGTREQIQQQQLNSALPYDQLKGVPRAIVDLIKRMLEVDPAKRPQSPGALKERLNKCIAAIDTAKHNKRRRFAYSALAAAAVIVAALGGSYILQHKFVLRNASEIAPEKSIAVLPFENFSRDPDNAFFADSVQDEILTDLSRIADLKVISRTSVMQYKSGIPRNLREIGQQLGVAHVVEGSVQRSGNRVRVNAQLVDARTDRHLWGQTYDRDLTDVFAIQSEIAETIADQLQGKVLPSEKNVIERPPTTNIIAFDLYTRAKNLLLAAGIAANERVNLFQAVDLLNRAVAYDPSFFDAYCQLAWVHDRIYFYGFDHTPARSALAEAAIEAAFRLRPDAGETHLARAWNLYWAYLSYEGALSELAVARRDLPNNPRILELKGYIERRQGRWEDSTRNLERALELDPRNVTTLQQTALSYLYLRRYAQEKSLLDRVLAITPNDVVTRATHAFIELDAKANTRPLHQIIDSVQTTNHAAMLSIADQWLLCALAERDAAAAEKALSAVGENAPHLRGDTVVLPRLFMEGVIANMRQNDHNAQSAFAAAHAEQEKIVQAQPNYAPAVCVLGLIDAGLGRKEEALHEGWRAVELLPAEKDPISGTTMIKYLAMIAAWVGDKDLACEQLAVAVRSPNSPTYGQLKLLPFWDPLRGDARFEKLVEEVKQPVELELTTTTVPEKSIAILPFANLSREPESVYFVDGIRAQIVARLAKIPNLKVVSGSSTQRYPSARKMLPKLPLSLASRMRWKGASRRGEKSSGSWSRLIDPKNNADLWAQTYDRSFSQITQVESDVAQQAAATLGVRLTEPEQRAIDKPPTSNQRAYEAYLKGRYVWLQRNYDSFQEAEEYFEQAIALDPNYARAYAGLADAYQFMAAFDSLGRKDNYQKAKNACQRALELDPMLAEAHASAGLIAMNYDWDWPRAEQELRRGYRARREQCAPL